MLPVELQRDADVVGPEGGVLLDRDRRIVVDVAAGAGVDGLAERDVVLGVEHGGVPHVVEPLAHRDLPVLVGGDQEHEPLVLDGHRLEVGVARVRVALDAVLHVQELPAEIPVRDRLPESRLLVGHAQGGVPSALLWSR